MNELRAQVDGDVERRERARENASARSVARFEDDRARGRFGKRACGRESGGSGPDHDDVGIHRARASA